jgi:D-alanine-D-alanine ligase
MHPRRWVPSWRRPAAAPPRADPARALSSAAHPPSLLAEASRQRGAPGLPPSLVSMQPTPQGPLTVGVAFGGVSPEHEVSVISALQAVENLDRGKYRAVPVYIAKSGEWFTGEGLFEIERYRDLDAVMRRATPAHLEQAEGRGAYLVERGGARGRTRLDVMFLGLHGGTGENGSLQGLCETFGLPYTGSGVFGSSLGMDKVVTKMLCRQQEVPVVDWVWFREGDWAGREEAWMDRIEAELGYPCVVKPARLGSSIGISFARDRHGLDRGIEEALRYDEKVVVERAVQKLREINCSVLGDVHHAEASVLEEPVRTEGEELLTFAEKYQRGGQAGQKGGRGAPRRAAKAPRSEGMASLDRMIPAPLSEEETEAIRALGVRVFQLFECAGVARIDFMIDDATGQVYFNEINTIPGSFSFYLWDPAGVPFPALLDRLISLALDRHRREAGRIRTYETNLLSERSLGGLKASKA